MSAAHHIEWLSLIEKTGPFLAVGVLEEAFPQDLEAVDNVRRRRVRDAYEEWSEAVESRDPDLDALHRQWIRLILSELLEYQPEILKTGEAIPADLSYTEPTSGEVIRPEYALHSGEKTHLLITCYPPDTDLEAPLAQSSWAASPIERMISLCRATGVRVGLVTNGELWSLVSAPADGSTSIGTWHARIWHQEPITLRAFVSLPGVRRFFGQSEGTLESLFAKSLAHQDGVTETLGEQVRRAIEVLVQALDRADVDRDRQLLKDVTPVQLYEAGLTVMMRLVVLLCAEERKLLLLGDPIYDQNYAASTLRSQLLKDKEQYGEEVLERRHDAWSRLLALFRGVYGGIDHEGLRLPPLGGSLFDPDRFPFLEGRSVGSSWRSSVAEPLPIDNRTVLLLLNALQILEQRAGAQLLTYESLDVEQIGHVYEGLLERTVKRVPEVTLGLLGSKKAVNPVIALSELERLQAGGEKSLLEALKELTGRSESAIKNALAKPLEENQRGVLLVTCGNDEALADRIAPYAHLIRGDSWGYPLIYPENAFIVAHGSDRRETGAHYTPKALTEPIVQHTLEPLVYIGPAEGLPQDQWKLKAPSELLALKVCDMAMGSAAFLVQTARYLGERLIESWDVAEKSGKKISIEGEVLEDAGSVELMSPDKGERLLIARRLIVSRCLYGVDINPMAVELAKVSLWLITMMKNRPFGFLDHALKCGDGLLGVSSLKQVMNFSLREGDRQAAFGTADLPKLVEEAARKRRDLEQLPSNDFTQIEQKNRLHQEAAEATSKVKGLADCLIAFELRGLDGRAYEEQLAEEASKAASALKDGTVRLEEYAKDRLEGRRPFHWAVEFPEVFAKGGFDAFVGNPPFLGGKRISTINGSEYERFLKETVGRAKGAADLCCYFFRRSHLHVRENGCVGLLATNSITEGDSPKIGLRPIIENGATIYRAVKSFPWPGTAGVHASLIHYINHSWSGQKVLDNRVVNLISPELEDSIGKRPERLKQVRIAYTQGTTINGEGFLIEKEEKNQLVRASVKNSEVIMPYLNGDLLNFSPQLEPKRFAINFGKMELSEASSFKEPFHLVTERVKPHRDRLTKQIHETRYWLYWDKREAFFERIKNHSHILVCAIVTTHIAFRFAGTGWVFSHKLKLFDTADTADFSLLQSSIHEVWARKYSSTLGQAINYSTSDGFDTFVLANQSDALRKIGAEYHARRELVMQTQELGLTEIYNRFHNPKEERADIVELRDLHCQLDITVAAAYGWSDLDLGHDFHETKQGIRFTISEAARREVLDRLLALNHQRYAEEVAAGLHQKKTKPKGKVAKNDDSQGELL